MARRGRVATKETEITAPTTIVEELEADLQTPGYIVGSYAPALRGGGPLAALGMLGLAPLRKDEREHAVNLRLGLGGHVSHTLHDTLAALAFAGDAATCAEIRRLAEAGDAAATAAGVQVSARTYRAYARAWSAWQTATVAAYRDGRITSAALARRAELLRAIARRLDALPTRAAQWDDAEVRTLREALPTFDRARGLTFLCQY
jgi:hypothetical protein